MHFIKPTEPLSHRKCYVICALIPALPIFVCDSEIVVVQNSPIKFVPHPLKLELPNVRLVE